MGKKSRRRSTTKRHSPSSSPSPSKRRIREDSSPRNRREHSTPQQNSSSPRKKKTKLYEENALDRQQERESHRANDDLHDTSFQSHSHQDEEPYQVSENEEPENQQEERDSNNEEESGSGDDASDPTNDSSSSGSDSTSDPSSSDSSSSDSSSSDSDSTGEEEREEDKRQNLKIKKNYARPDLYVQQHSRNDSTNKTTYDEASHLPETLKKIKLFSSREVNQLWKSTRDQREKNPQVTLDAMIQAISTIEQWQDREEDELQFALTRIWNYEENISKEEKKMQDKNNNREILIQIKLAVQTHIEKISKGQHVFKNLYNLEKLTQKEKIQLATEIFTEEGIAALDSEDKAEKKVIRLLQQGWPTLKYAVMGKNQQHATGISHLKDTLAARIINETELEEEDKSLWHLFIQLITDEVVMLTKEVKKKEQEQDHTTTENLQKTIRTLKAKIEEQQQDIMELEKKTESIAKELRKKSRDYVDTKQKYIKLEEDILMVERDKRKLEMEIEKKDLFLKTLHADANIPFLEDSITNLRQLHGKTKQTPSNSPLQAHKHLEQAPQHLHMSKLQFNNDPTTQIRYTWTTHSKAFQKELQRRGITTFKFGGTKDSQKNAEHFLNVWDQLLTLFPFDDNNKIHAFRATMDVGDTTTRGLMAALENKEWEEYYKTLKQTAGLTNDSPSQNMFLLMDLQQTPEMSVTEYYGRFFELLQRSIPMPGELQVKWFIRGLLNPLKEPMERWIQEQTSPPTLSQTKDKAQSEYHIKLQANPINPKIIASINPTVIKKATKLVSTQPIPAHAQHDSSSSDSDDDIDFAVTLNDVNAIHTAKYLQPQPQHSPRYQEVPQPSRNSREEERPRRQPRQDYSNSREEEQPRRQPRQDYSRSTRSPSPRRHKRSLSPKSTRQTTSDKHRSRRSPPRTRRRSRSPSPKPRVKVQQDRYHNAPHNEHTKVPHWAIPEETWREARHNGSLFGVKLPNWEKTANHRTSFNAQIELQAIDDAYQQGYGQLLPRRKLTIRRKEDFFVDDEENAYCLIHDTYGDHSTYRCPFNTLSDNPNFLYFPDQEDRKTRLFEDKNKQWAEKLRKKHEERRP